MKKARNAYVRSAFALSGPFKVIKWTCGGMKDYLRVEPTMTGF